MKLQFLKIKNYKSILDFECQLGEGINVFVGQSDSGKSNVVRALRDFFFNASGDSVITAKQTRCSIAINDCVWEKGKGINRYVLPMGTFENVGRTSPQELRDLFKIDEINWDETHVKKLQFIQQHEPKFFIDESFTGSLNAKILGLVSGIQRTYNGNRLVINDIRDAKGRRETALSIKETSEKELVKYAKLPKQKHILDVIEKSILALEEMETKHNRIVKITQEITDTSNRISRLEQCILKDALIDPEAIQRLQKDALCNLKIRKLASEAVSIHQEITRAKKVEDLEIDMEDFNKMQTLTTNTVKIKSATHALVTIRSEHRLETSGLEKLEADLVKTTADLRKIIDETDVCPLTDDEFCSGCKDKIATCTK